MHTPEELENMSKEELEQAWREDAAEERENAQVCPRSIAPTSILLLSQRFWVQIDHLEEVRNTRGTPPQAGVSHRHGLPGKLNLAHEVSYEIDVSGVNHKEEEH